MASSLGLSSDGLLLIYIQPRFGLQLSTDVPMPFLIPHKLHYTILCNTSSTHMYYTHKMDIAYIYYPTYPT